MADGEELKGGEVRFYQFLEKTPLTTEEIRKKIYRKTGISLSWITVQRALAKLEEKGLIVHLRAGNQHLWSKDLQLLRTGRGNWKVPKEKVKEVLRKVELWNASRLARELEVSRGTALKYLCMLEAEGFLKKMEVKRGKFTFVFWEVVDYSKNKIKEGGGRCVAKESNRC